MGRVSNNVHHIKRTWFQKFTIVETWENHNVIVRTRNDGIREGKLFPRISIGLASNEEDVSWSGTEGPGSMTD